MCDLMEFHKTDVTFEPTARQNLGIASERKVKRTNSES